MPTGTKDECNNAIEPRATPPTDVPWHDDAANPRNFSLRRRTASTVAVTCLAFVSTFAGSIISPAQSQLSTTFDVSPETAVLPLALYNLGLAFGPCVGAPLCETYGRRAVFVAAGPVFALFTLGAGLARDMSALVACRFFAGVFASPAIGNASATIVDYTAGRYRAVSLAFYYSVPFVGAVLGPVVGGLVVEARGWRWTQWTTLFCLVVFYVPVLFTRETYTKAILRRREAARARGAGSLVAVGRDVEVVGSVGHFATTLLLRPVHMFCTEPIVTLVCLYNGFLFGLMYTFVTAQAGVFEDVYGFTPTGQALSFLGLVTGALVAPIPLILIDLYIYQPRLRRWKASRPMVTTASEPRFPPENRLFPSMFACCLLPTSLFVFAWTARPTIHFIVPIVFQGLTILSSLLIYASANIFMLDSYGPLYGASAAGAAMLTRYSFSAAFPLFARQMYHGLGVGVATSILGGATLAMAPIPWLFWKYGEGLRNRMKYESSA